MLLQTTRAVAHTHTHRNNRTHAHLPEAVEAAVRLVELRDRLGDLLDLRALRSLAIRRWCGGDDVWWRKNLHLQDLRLGTGGGAAHFRGR